MKQKQVKERFDDKVMPAIDGCHYWIGARKQNRYGWILHEGKRSLAHRVSYRLNKGIIPKGMLVCHHCDNVLCVNPDHLFLGTPNDNMQDMIRKGRKVVSKGEQNGCSKLSTGDIDIIKSMKNQGLYQKDVAELFGVCRQTIQLIWADKIWNSVTSK